MYGPNLTKYFQRAMSRKNGISIITIEKGISGGEINTSYNNYRAIQKVGKCGMEHYCVPIVFIPMKYFEQLRHVEDASKLEPLYAEPLGNGMVEYLITDEDALWDTGFFLHYIKKRLGKDLYNLDEIAGKRKLIK